MAEERMESSTSRLGRLQEKLFLPERQPYIETREALNGKLWRHEAERVIGSVLTAQEMGVISPPLTPGLIEGLEEAYKIITDRSIDGDASMKAGMFALNAVYEHGYRSDI